MTAQLVADALLMAVWRRGKPDGLLHHTQAKERGLVLVTGDGKMQRIADADSDVRLLIL
jgi:hypothetical protein